MAVPKRGVISDKVSQESGGKHSVRTVQKRVGRDAGDMATSESASGDDICVLAESSRVCAEGQLLLSSVDQLIRQVHVAMLLAEQPNYLATLVSQEMMPDIEEYTVHRHKLNCLLQAACGKMNFQEPHVDNFAPRQSERPSAFSGDITDVCFGDKETPNKASDPSIDKEYILPSTCDVIAQPSLTSSSPSSSSSLGDHHRNITSHEHQQMSDNQELNVDTQSNSAVSFLSYPSASTSDMSAQRSDVASSKSADIYDPARSHSLESSTLLNEELSSGQGCDITEVVSEVDTDTHSSSRGSPESDHSDIKTGPSSQLTDLGKKIASSEENDRTVVELCTSTHSLSIDTVLLENQSALQRQVDLLWRISDECAKCVDGHSSSPLPDLKNKCSSSLLQHLRTLKQQMYERLSKSPDQDQIHLQTHRAILRKDLQNAKIERDLAARLESLRVQRREQKLVNEQMERQTNEQIENFNKSAQAKVNEIVEAEEYSVAVDCVEYDNQAAKYDAQLTEIHKSLEQTQEHHHQEETALSQERDRTKTRLLEWIAKYDEEMISRQHQLDTMQKQYEEDIVQRERYEHLTSVLKPQFERISERKQQQEALAVMEENLRRKEAAARVILKYWRAFRATKRRETKKQKKTGKRKKSAGRKTNKKRQKQPR